MSQQILAVLEYLEKEKGIPRAEMIRTISDAIVLAAQRGVNAGQKLEVEINPRTGALNAYSVLDVVDSVGDTRREIHVSKARTLDSRAQVGGVIRQAIDPSFLGRIAAHAARQAINDGVRDFERTRVCSEFESHVGKIVSGIVRRKEVYEAKVANGRPIVDYILEIGKVEGLLAQREMIPGEEFRIGDSVRALLLNLGERADDPALILSRSIPRFVTALLQLEISELGDGSVEIVRMVREAGYRTKIAVASRDQHIDPVGACVGSRGMRIKAIIKELSGEKLDVIRYSENLTKFLTEALRPVIPQNVEISEKEQRIRFAVSEPDLPLVIGKRGMNARLTSRLLNWRLDIGTLNDSQAKFDAGIQQATADLGILAGVSASVINQLIGIGITSAEALGGVTVGDLVDAGLTMEDAVVAIDAFKCLNKTNGASELQR
ncbi:MAG: transcription termination factor NusA [Puniceicoccales bacterium]|jgi:N utilization substance protein A|nr:transcription termination factor NusA [Puniceicoccales bacterium]